MRGVSDGLLSSRYLKSSPTFRRGQISNDLAISNRGSYLKRTGLKNNEASDISSALQGRLEEILIFELHQDGGREFLQLSVRGLYRYVIEAITSPLKVKPEEVEDAEEKEPEEEEEKEGKTVSFEVQETVETSGQTHESLSAVPGKTEASSSKETEVDITYHERLGGYLHPRDMRRLVTPFSASNEPGIIVRRHVMLLNFDPLRAIILRDRLLVLVPEGADSILIKLEQRVRGGIEEIEHSVFGSEMGADNPTEPNKLEQAEIASDQSVDGSKRESFGKTSLIRKILRKSDQGSGDLPHSRHGTKKTRPGKQGPLQSVLQSTLQQKESRTSCTMSDDVLTKEFDELYARDWIDLPFELQCADAVLNIVCSILSEDAYELEQASQRYFNYVLFSQRRGQADDPLQEIRRIKDSIKEMSSRINRFVDSMNKILDDDESMALMNLTHLITQKERFIKPVRPDDLEEEADEPELMLEAHLQVGLSLANAIDLIQGQIDTASELVDQKLDATRNRILLSNMIISVFALCISTGSLVGSIFGMNLLNHLEDSEVAFRNVTASTVMGCFALVLIIIGLLFFTGAIPTSRTSY